MPWMQRALGRLNSHFSEESIAQLIQHREIFAPGRDWLLGVQELKGELAERAGQVADTRELNWLRRAPRGLLEMARALIYENLNRGNAEQEQEALSQVLPMTWAWAPGYDWELTVWECPGREGSRGAFTILFKSRYPGDPLPVDRLPDRAG